MPNSVETTWPTPSNAGGHPHPSLQELPPVLKVDSVARVLRVNRKTVYEMARANSIPGTVRMGRALRFSRDALLHWLGVPRTN